MNGPVLVFDIDGTLTASRQPMTPELAAVLRPVAEGRPVYLVTGSDYSKVAEQVPGAVLARVAGVFTCVGNEFWQGGGLVRSRRHEFPAAMVAEIEAMLMASDYGVRTGRHVEERAGTLNVSVVGRNADLAQRAAYHAHDIETGERGRLAARIEARFPAYEARRGGQISVDVSPRGWNKAQVVPEIRRRHGATPIHFFADNLGEDGNDLPLAQALVAEGPHNRVNAVTGWRDTLAILERDYMPARQPARSA